MPTYKDWMPGEARVSLKVISASGTSYEVYIPHATEVQGLAFYLLALQVMNSKDHYDQAERYFAAKANQPKTKPRRAKPRRKKRRHLHLVE